MSLYKRGDVWWYKFRFAGQVLRESSKSESRTVAKEASALDAGSWKSPSIAYRNRGRHSFSPWRLKYG